MAPRKIEVSSGSKDIPKPEFPKNVGSIDELEDYYKTYLDYIVKKTKDGKDINIEQINELQRRLEELSSKFNEGITNLYKKQFKDKLDFSLKQGETIGAVTKQIFAEIDTNVKQLKETVFEAQDKVRFSNDEIQDVYGQAQLKAEEIENLKTDLEQDYIQQLEAISKDKRKFDELIREQAIKSATLSKLRTGKQTYKSFFKGRGKAAGAFGRTFARLMDFRRSKQVQSSQPLYDRDEFRGDDALTGALSYRSAAYGQQLNQQQSPQAQASGNIPIVTEQASKVKVDTSDPDTKADIVHEKPKEAIITDLTLQANTEISNSFKDAIEDSLIPFLRDDFIDSLAKLIKTTSGSGSGISSEGDYEEDDDVMDFFDDRDRRKKKNNRRSRRPRRTRNRGPRSRRPPKGPRRTPRMPRGGKGNLIKNVLRYGKQGVQGAMRLARGGGRLALQGGRMAAQGIGQAAGAATSYLTGGLGVTGLATTNVGAIGSLGAGAVAGAALAGVGAAAGGAYLGYKLEEKFGLGTKALEAVGVNSTTNKREAINEETNEKLAEVQNIENPLDKKIAFFTVQLEDLLKQQPLLKGDEKKQNESMVQKVQERLKKLQAQKEEESKTPPVNKEAEKVIEKSQEVLENVEQDKELKTDLDFTEIIKNNPDVKAVVERAKRGNPVAINQMNNMLNGYHIAAGHGIDVNNMSYEEVKDASNRIMKGEDVSDLVAPEKAEAYQKSREEFKARGKEDFSGQEVTTGNTTKAESKEGGEELKPELNTNNKLTATTNEKLDILIETLRNKEMGSAVLPIVNNQSNAAAPSSGTGQTQSPAYTFRSQNRN